MAAIYGDVSYIAPCRFFCSEYSFTGNQIVYRYRFNVSDPRFPPKMGVTHARETSFVWNNPAVRTDDMRSQVTDFMSRAWAAFIVDQDPNNHGVQNIPSWEPYSKSALGQNFVIGEDGFSKEVDNFRGTAINVIIAEILKL